MKLDLLTNATVIDDAIRFVSSHNPILVAMKMNLMNQTIMKTKMG